MENIVKIILAKNKKQVKKILKNMKKGTLTIKKVSHEKLKEQCRFTLTGENGEHIGGSATETYTQKHNIIELAAVYFPNFEIVDKTK